MNRSEQGVLVHMRRTVGIDEESVRALAHEIWEGLKQSHRNMDGRDARQQLGPSATIEEVNQRRDDLEKEQESIRSLENWERAEEYIRNSNKYRHEG